MTPVKLKIFETLFQHHVQPLLQELVTIATGPQSTFANIHTQMKIATEQDVNGAVNMTADMSLKLQVHLSNAEAEVTTGSC